MQARAQSRQCQNRRITSRALQYYDTTLPGFHPGRQIALAHAQSLTFSLNVGGQDLLQLGGQRLASVGWPGGHGLMRDFRPRARGRQGNRES
jgi:hypothetical protein